MSTNTLKQALEIVYGDIKNINKRVKNLESASIGVLYTETTKSAVAYQDNVSANVCPYALLNILGAMSHKSENLLVLTNTAVRREGVTFTTNIDGSVKLNGTATNNQYSCFTNLYEGSNSFPNGVKAGDYISLKLFGTITNVTMLVYYYTTSWEILINSQTTVSNVQIPSNAVGLMIRVGCLSSGITFNNQVVYPMLVSGSTAPTEYQPYFEGIRDSAVISVISKDSNNTTLQTITIPNEIQALEGYGWGINDTCYNYIDFENKKFVKKVGRVKIKDLNWTYNNNNTFYASLSGNKKVANNVVANLLCVSYNSSDFNSVYFRTKDKIISSDSNYSQIWAYDTSYTTVADFVANEGDKYLYFELAIPIETDISQYIDDNSIQIESNGTITFGNTYQQAIPYEYLYLEKVGANNE